MAWNVALFEPADVTFNASALPRSSSAMAPTTGLNAVFFEGPFSTSQGSGGRRRARLVSLWSTCTLSRQCGSHCMQSCNMEVLLSWLEPILPPMNYFWPRDACCPINSLSATGPPVQCIAVRLPYPGIDSVLEEPDVSPRIPS